MLRYSMTLAIIFSSTAGVTTAVAQPPPAAGANRPKLQVLQALPESQLFPLMNLLADSLGVRCDYCHVQATPDFTRTPSNLGGWVWDSDDKPQKRTAREMMRMVVDLNAGRFKGESRITCYTCHRGTTQPARTPPLPPPAPAGATTKVPLPLPTADRVWTNYVAAVGPGDTGTRGTGTIIAGWDDRPEGRYGKVEIVLSGTDRYRVTLSTSTGTISQGLDGDIAWAASNDRVQRLSGADVVRMRRIAMRYRPIKERPPNLQVVGVERVLGRDAYVAAARLDATTTWTLYFDAVTGLLRRERTTSETILLPLEEQVDYEDYRDVGGVKLPFRVLTSDGASYDTVTRTFLQVRRNVAVDDALFRPPSEPR
ncbi:MAG TPA: c-type cytochrome [Vicinamibacterales bacterium]|nr:c-type cytochrome [Vicinamibacterales bacterium]